MQKAKRLIQLIMMVNAKKSFTVKELADELGISTRTVSRDLQELSELGVPIYSIQGRGGGHKLLRERLLPPISFTENEAVALFFACQSLEYFGSVPFGDAAGSALRKFYHYLPIDVRERIDRLRDRVAIWSPHRSMSKGVLETLLEAIMSRCIVTIEYNSETRVSKRDIQPIGLYASSGYWYCPAYCFESETVKQFRADRILSACLDVTKTPNDDISQLTLLDKPRKDHLPQTVLRLELTKRGTWLLASNNRFAPYIHRKEDGSATAEVPIAAEDLPFYSDLIWSFGTDVRITAPEEVIAILKRKAESMRQMYE